MTVKIEITNIAQRISSLAHRNELIVQAAYDHCVKAIGPVSPKISVLIDLLDESDLGAYDNANKILTLNVLLTPQRVVKIMLHELCHANQYYSRRMRDRRKANNHWEVIYDGEVYPHPKTASVDYWNMPWEQEARMSEGASSKVISKIKHWDELRRKPYWLLES